MKKTFFSLSFFLSSLFGAYSGHFAQPCYLCPTYFSFPSGYVFDRIEDKNLVAIDPSIQAPNFNKLKLKSNYALLSFCLLRKFEVFTLLGKTKAEIDWEEGLPFDKKTNSHFSWQAGIRGHLFTIKPVCVGFSSSYFAVPKLKEDSDLPKYVQVDVDLSVPKSFTLREWQTSLGVFMPIYCVIPYIAVQYSATRFDLYTKDPSLHIKYKNKNNFGLVIGGCVNIGQKLFLSVEKRYYTEDAVSFSVAFVF